MRQLDSEAANYVLTPLDGEERFSAKWKTGILRLYQAWQQDLHVQRKTTPQISSQY